MRHLWVAAALAALPLSAHAQETGAAPAPQVAPSSCAAFTEAPAPPDGATATAEQVQAAVAAYEVWRAATQATLDCRAAEVRSLNAQATARANEYRTAQAENAERAAAFQAQLDIFAARRQR